jgi:hypothetical protein
MPTNAFLTTAAIGFREDLIDVIYNTSPADTPFISMIDKVKADAVTHEWQRDVLTAPASNSVAEGADASYTAITPTQRLSNQTQISRKTFSISDTQERIIKAGRKSEIRYQLIKQGKELWLAVFVAGWRRTTAWALAVPHQTRPPTLPRLMARCATSPNPCCVRLCWVRTPTAATRPR